MADTKQKPNANDAPPPLDPPKDAPPAPPPADASATDPIVEQGTPPDNVPQSAPKLAPAGKYRVIHGSITFAPGKVAYPGALVNLTSEEAGPMLDVGTIAPEK